MTLSEKIFYYRKKAGFSQDSLADKLGVSRQSISKWETGESVPETKNLLSLATILGTTVDSLLSDESPEEESTVSNNSDWINRLPKCIKKLFLKFGWLIGLYFACLGVLCTAFGRVAKRIFINMYPDILWEDPAFQEMQANDPMILISNFATIIGILLLIIGIILTIILFKKRKSNV